MKICPFTRKACLKDKCACFSKEYKECVFLSIVRNLSYLVDLGR